MQTPLPSVGMAYAAIQQEEAQRDVLNISLEDLDVSAMFNKGVFENNKLNHDNTKFLTYTSCGGKGHSKVKCWSVVGYPKWHHKHKKSGQKSKW